jgi:hypothetical protein
VNVLDDMAARDPLFAEELEALSPDQRRWLEDDLVLRHRAALLAAELALDASDVYHQLKQFKRSARERLRIGLAHGRRRLRVAE